jgi:Flp pilus assembly protein protease CpaA
MLEIILIAVGLVGGFAAGIYDLKTTNIPDKVCIGMILFGLIAHVLTGIFTGDFSYFINSLIFGGLFLGFGLLMYYTSQWGGGDGELLVAIGVVLPSLHSVSTFFPFALSFFLNSFFIGAAWSIAYSIWFVSRNPTLSRKFVKDFKNPVVMSVSIVLLSLFVIASTFSMFFSVLFLLALAALILYNFSKLIEKAFYIRIPTSRLRVDDMLGEDIPSLKLYKKYITGLTKAQVAKIKKHKRFVVIREGVRYGIVFPLALLFTVFFGDFVLLLFKPF